MVTLSVIIPVYNEVGSIGPLLDDVEKALDSIPRESEIIVVDDGSRDGTFEELEKHRLKSRYLHVLRLQRNFGQTSAMAAGFHAARGDVLVTMDGDGQNDPMDIPDLLAQLDEGYDIVSGWRKNRQDNVMSRVIPSVIANWLLAEITGVRLHDFGCTLKVYRAGIIRKLHLYSDMHRFIPGLAAAVGARVGEQVVRHHPRRDGVSKYGIGRTWKLLTDMVVLRLLVRFSGHPMHYFGLLGIFTFMIALGLSFVAFVDTGTLELVDSSTVILPAIGTLCYCLSFYFLMMGLLCELALRSSSARETAYAPMAREECFL
ncbi:MAG: glycosyltransferase family 2 protein [Planctomycetota bacterium]|nr:glycosyltransferase family 2 protein [Planctomycetota bacterium]